MRRALIATMLATATVVGSAAQAGATVAPTATAATAGDPTACAEAFAPVDGGLTRRTAWWGDQTDNSNGTFTVQADLVGRTDGRTPNGPAVVVSCAFADDNGNGTPDPGEARFGSRQAVTFEASSASEQTATVAITVPAAAHTRICDRSVARSADRTGSSVARATDIACRRLGSRSLPIGGMVKGLLAAAGVATAFGWWQRRSSGVLALR